MRIYNISRIIAAPFIAAAVYVFIQASDDFGDKSLSIWLIPLGLILILLYVFQNQINIWWLKKYPMPLDQKDKDILSKYSSNYNDLSVNEKLEFESNIFLMTKTKEFTAMGSQKEGVPYDLQLVLAMIGVELASKTDTPLLENFDKVILYKHPFPSPLIQQLHTVEINGEDGVILMAMDHLSAAVHNPSQYYHIGYHGWAQAFIYENPKIDYPSEIQWKTIEAITGFPAKGVAGALGLPQVDTLPIGITLYFTHGDKMKDIDRRLYDHLESIFHRYGTVA